jgi:hypothetical protein
VKIEDLLTDKTWPRSGRISIGEVELARLPPASRPFEVIPADTSTWSTAGWQSRAWGTAVARLSDRVELVPVPTVGIEAAASASDWSVSRHGPSPPRT